MGNIINIVVDASGSMTEDDKNAVVKYLINGICNVKETKEFTNAEFVLFQWGINSVKFENIETAKLEFKGKNSYKNFSTIKDDIDYESPMILISDGEFNEDDKEEIKKLSKQIIPIFVGVDANRAVLKDIATDKVVYSVTDFMQALGEANI